MVVHFADQRAAATAWTCEERPATGLPVTARIAFAGSSERYDLPRIAAQPGAMIDFALVQPHLDFLYNLARYETGHALGFGSASAFRAPVVGDVLFATFGGQQAMAPWAGPVPLAEGVHWVNNPTVVTFTPPPLRNRESR